MTVRLVPPEAVPLINRLPPLDNEGLPGYLERLRRANYYDEIGWYKHATKADFEHTLHLLRARVDLSLFAGLTGLSLDTVFGLTLHRFMPCFYSPDELAAFTANAKLREQGDIARPLWSNGGLNQYAHRTAKICPECWREYRTTFLPWFLRPVTACAEHKVLLIERCPHCTQNLRLNLVTGKCMACGYDVDQMAGESIAGSAEGVEFVQVAWSALAGGAEGRGKADGAGDWEGQGQAGAGWLPDSVVIAQDNPVRGMTPFDFHQFFHRLARVLVPYAQALGIGGIEGEHLGLTSSATFGKLRTIDNSQRHNLHVFIWRLLQTWGTDAGGETDGSWYNTLARIAAHESALDRASDKKVINYPFPGRLLDEFQGPGWRWLNNSWMVFTRERSPHSSDVHHWLFNYRFAEREGWASGAWTSTSPSAPEAIDAPGTTTESAIHNSDADWGTTGADGTTESAVGLRGLTLITVREASQILDLNLPRIKILIDKGKLHFVAQLSKGAKGTKLALLDADEVWQYSESRGATLMLIDLKKRFGFGFSTVTDMVTQGLLVAENAVGRQASGTWGFRDADVQECLESIMGSLPLCPADADNKPDEWLTLPATTVKKRQRKVTTCDLLQAIKDGVIPAYRIAPPPPATAPHTGTGGKPARRSIVTATDLRLQDIRIKLDDAERFLATPKDGLYTRNSAARMVGCKLTGMARLYRNGLLLPSVGDPADPNTWRYTAEDMAKYMDRYIDGKSAAAFLGVTTGTLYGWVKRGLLTAAAGRSLDGTWLWRFDKYALAEWREERMTLGEAMVLLGEPAHRINRWVRDGKVRLLAEYSGGDKRKCRWYSREDLVRMHEEQGI